MTIAQQVVHAGFQFEEHKIQTDDGYILTAQRIPGRLKEVRGGSPKQPVQLQHGVIDQGGTWFFNEASKSLALQLADEGYDVWVTNSRGTALSSEHVKYRDTDPEFWDFSVHDMAMYDVPANLAYIKEKSGAEQIIYIGHSQGTM